MKKSKNTNYKLKKAVNRLLNRKPSIEPPSRKTLMYQIKNIILTNKQLNHRCMDFNYAKEYKQMHKTMTRFNSEQNSRKNLVSRLNNENHFFTKSYPNIISSLAIQIDKLNINYKTISNFNQKYEKQSNNSKENNFFYEDPLLLTKSKDLDNFYINENITSTRNDESLNYSRKLLLDVNSNSPLNRVIKIIEKYSPKKPFKEIFSNNNNLTERNDIKNNLINNNTNIESKTLSDRNINSFRNKKLLFNNYNNINKINKEEEIKTLRKYNRSIKKLIRSNMPERKYTQKNISILKLSSVLNNEDTNNNYINGNNNNNADNNKDDNNIVRTYTHNNYYKFNRLNAILSSKNVKPKIINKLNDVKPQKKPLLNLNVQNNDFIYKDIEKLLPKRNKFQKSIKKKLLKMKQLKGSIQIQNIYKDLVKTKETVHEYEKDKQPKFKYLYSLFNDKNLIPFQKEENQNIKIKKLDRDLFWTVNEFHNN